ncbi:hypothetical protein [Crenobacter luteus]|uniref:hypothetical protein n=1 Tax=Crenobacter luteus TaxID=1452487 RepID=UPI001FB8404F|nr:hypothetical protein [Crenobacter luteus]
MKPASMLVPTKFVALAGASAKLCGAMACRVTVCHGMTPQLDPNGIGRYRAPVAVSPATGFSSPNQSPRSSVHAVFAALVRLQWAALVGRASALPVRDCRSANPALRRPTRLAAGSGNSNANPEGTMTHIIPRALSRLFPVFAVPVTTLPTLAEARALAALLVSRGKRVSIAPAAHGYTVAEVAR